MNLAVRTSLVSKIEGSATRHSIEVVDGEICDDAIVIDLADDGHPTDIVIPAAAIGKRIPVQRYIDQARRDYAPLASALRRYLGEP